jgi:raffinose/stachyose/melibiose transport system permease protein
LTARAASRSGSQSAAGRGRSGRLPKRQYVSTAGLLVVLLIMMSPFLIMVGDSLRSDYSAGTYPLGLPTHPQWGNYADVFRQMSYLSSLGNSLLITGCSVIVVILAGSLCSYPLARLARRWTTLTYGLFVIGITVPEFVVLTPLYLLMHQLGLLNSYLSVILAYSALNLPFAVFFYTGFLKAIPIELEEQAAIDGCSTIGTFFRIVLPLLRPATATLSIFISIAIWNDLALPLLFLPSGKNTVTLGVYSFISATKGFETSQLFPAVVLGIAPLFMAFLILQRHIIAGITAGVGKG